MEIEKDGPEPKPGAAPESPTTSQDTTPGGCSHSSTPRCLICGAKLVRPESVVAEACLTCRLTTEVVPA